MFSDFLSTLAAAGSATTISRARIAIADAAASGKLSQAAAEALEAVSRVAAEHIAAHGEKPERPERAPAKAAAKPVAERHAATIRSCRRTDFSDTGPQLRGDLEVSGHGIIQYRVKLDGGGSEKGFRRAVDALGAIEPGDMVSRVVAVELAPWTNALGETKTLVNRWHAPEEAPAAAPAAQPHAQEQTPRAPRRGTAAKARAAWEHDDEIPF